MSKTHCRADARYLRTNSGGSNSKSKASTDQILSSMSPNLAQLTPELRQRVYEEVLEDNRVFLCRHLDPSRHCTYLRSKRYFDRTIQELINQPATTHDKVNRFIDEVQKKGPDACAAFLESLMENKVEQYVLGRLLEAYENYPYENLIASDPAGDGGCGDDVSNSDEERRLSGKFDSSTYEGASVAAADSPVVPVLPKINYQRLLECEGRLDRDRFGQLEPEEGSDISSIDCLTSHGN